MSTGAWPFWYSYDRYLQIVVDGAITTTIEGCLDRAVKAAYDAQHGQTMRQWGFYQISGVHLAPNGDIYLAAVHGIARVGTITRFASDGRPLQSFRFDFPPGLRLNTRITFLHAPDVLLSWQGGIESVDIWRLNLPK